MPDVNHRIAFNCDLFLTVAAPADATSEELERRVLERLRGIAASSRISRLRTSRLRMSEMIQFQCQREGSIFYVQHASAQCARVLVTHCPVCGSKRVEETGRTYPPVNETKPLPKFEAMAENGEDYEITEAEVVGAAATQADADSEAQPQPSEAAVYLEKDRERREQLRMRGVPRAY